MRRKTKENFYKMFEITPSCWIWKGCLNWDGYGKYKGTTAHRFSWIFHKGPIKSRHIYACHSCDNRKCVNPKHLWLGSAKQNMKDCIKKGRFVFNGKPGEEGTNSILTKNQVSKIRRFYRRGRTNMNQLALSEIFGVSRQAIGCIVRGETWK